MRAVLGRGQILKLLLETDISSTLAKILGLCFHWLRVSLNVLFFFFFLTIWSHCGLKLPNLKNSDTFKIKILRHSFFSCRLRTTSHVNVLKYTERVCESYSRFHYWEFGA